MGRPWIRLTLAPLLAALLVVGVQALRKPPRDALFDELYYLTIARDLQLFGVFTNGTFKRGPFGRAPGPEHFGDESPSWATPGRFFAPAYPMLIAALATVDRGLADSIRCQVKYGNLAKPQEGCPRAFRSLILVQIVLWAIAMLAIFRIAWALTSSETVAWLAMIIALATGEAGFYARTYLSENLTVPAFLMFMLFAVRWVLARRLGDCIAAGCALGVAALARPAYVYLFYMIAGAMALAALGGRRRDWLPRPVDVAAFVAAALVVLAPWMLRNWRQFGDPALSSGYAEVILVQRLAYNQMSWSEWWVAWIYWLPDFGDDVARLLFRPELWEKLGWTHPQNYYLDGGEGAYRRRIIEASPDDAGVLPQILKTHLLGDIWTHIVVTFPLTMRGLGVAKYLSVAGVILLWPVARRMWARGRLAGFLALLLPPLAMAGLHGFVSVNIDRYNIPMIAVYAVVVAVILEAAVRRWARP